MSDEKAAELLAELAGEAFKETGGDVYRAGQPLQGDKTVEHAAGEKKSEEQPKETTSERLIAGKWKNIEETEKGVHELLQYTSGLKDKTTALETKLEAVTAALSVLNGGAAPNGAPKEQDPFEMLEALGTPKDYLQKAIEMGVEKKFQETLRPVAERQKADQEVLKLYPEYEKEFDGLMQFLETHPDIKKEVEYAENQGQFLLARKYAWLSFDRTERVPQKQGEVEKKAQKREERVKETLPDAGVGAGGPRNEGRAPAPSPDWPSDERMKYLKDLAQAGHPDPMWRETLGRILEQQGFPKQ